MAEVSDPNRWDLVRKIFGGALEREPATWRQYLREHCAGDSDLRREVESLLEAHQAGRDFLSVPLFGGRRKSAQHGGESLLGQRLGAYRIEHRIGCGGMGTVYSAVRADSAFDKRVAVKLLKREIDSAQVVRRFQAERQILARLEHPHIARLLDGGTAPDGRPYLVMEFVEGLPIDEYCHRHKLGISERIELFRQALTAVQFAHRNLVVHRDLKPSNILVTVDGEPKLLDFGIAKILDPEPPNQLSLSGPETEMAAEIEERDGGGQRRTSAREAPPAETLSRLMTPSYASPEQVLGQPVTTASDVYALGVLLYLLLTGRHPLRLENRSQVEVLWAIRRQHPEPPSRSVGCSAAEHQPRTSLGPEEARQWGRRLAGDLDNIVLKALHKEPEQRYASVDQLSEDLHRHLTHWPISAGPESFHYRSGKFVRRHRLGVLSTAIFCFAILGFGLAMAIQRSQIVRERDRLSEQQLKTETERLRAERVIAFLTDLLTASDPFSDAVDVSQLTARELLDRGVERLAVLDAEPAARADLSHTVGVIYRRIGRSDEAQSLLSQALRIRQTSGDPAKLADSLEQWGLSRREAGDFETAEESLRQSLELRRTRFGSGHPRVADSLSHLASLAEEKGEFQAAERLQRQALGIYRNRFDGDQDVVAASLHQLALIVLSQGDHEAAEQFFSEALAMQTRLFGEEHLQVARTRCSLAELLLRRGDYGAAEQLYRGAVETLRQSLGTEHIDVAFATHGLAMTLWGQGDLETAESLYRQALELLVRLRGAEHPDLVATLSGLGRVLLAKGDFEGAESSYLTGLKIRRQHLGEASPYLVINLTGLGRVALKKRDYAAAERWLDRSLEIGYRSFPQGHWRLDMAKSLLGACRLGIRRYAEAEPLLLESYRSLKTRRGAQAPVTQAALDRLIALYEAWDRPEEAAKLSSERGEVNLASQR